MPTNNPAPRRDNDGDNIAAVPIVEKKPFNWLYLTPLLLLLLIPFCTHRENPAPDRPVTTVASPTVATRTALLNPFTVHATGPDMGKAVLNFDANTTTPNSDASSVLRDVVAYLQANPAARVSLKGYTDNSGPADVNKRLTQQRLDAVKSALTTAGVDAGRIAASNFGEAYPVTDNSTVQAREMNRRVEIELAR